MSKRIVIPIGPQHPSLKEPACFTITLEGEKVVQAVVGVGYNHRGLEKSCESRNYIQCLYILERVCGICSHSHSTTFLQGIEELAEIEIPTRAKYIRCLMGELERLHSHLLWFGVAAHEIGFDTLFMYSWRDREMVLEALATLGGNRVNYGINKPGGVRRDIDDDYKVDLHKMCNKLEDQLNYYIELAFTDATLAARLGGIGCLSHDECLYYGAVGPVARAAGIAEDMRRDDPYAVYSEIPFEVITDDHADVFGRTVVRLKEMVQSVHIIRFVLDNMPDGELCVKFPRKVPAGEIISRYEAPRGEDLHFIRSNGTDKPERIRVRAPSEANWHGMAHMLEGDYLADVPIIVAAIDPCYSCTDRAVVLNNRDNGTSSMLEWKDLRQYSIDWYKERGVDITAIKI